MKKLLTLLAAVTCFSQSYGQFELGINGGFLVNRTPWLGDGKSATYTQSPRLSGYGSLRTLAHVRNNWQIGFGIDLATIKSNLTAEKSKVPPVTFYGTIQVGDPNIPLYLMLNRTIKAPRGYAYAGMNVGIAFITGTRNSITKSTRIIANTENHGFQAGLQLGYTWRLLNRVGANAELGARYLSTGVPNPSAKTNTDITYDIWYFPVSLGLRYKI